MNAYIKSINENVVVGNRQEVELGVNQALAADIDPDRILREGLIEAMNEVGDRFERGDLFIPEMLIAAQSMRAGLEILKPHLLKAELKTSSGKVVLGTVKGDLHDIGINLVSMMLEGAGFEVIDLGRDVSIEQFLDSIKENVPDILGMSALLTTTMPNMKLVIEALENTNLRSSVKVIIGGAPVTQEYAQEIGADGYAPDASRAVKLVRELI